MATINVGIKISAAVSYDGVPASGGSLVATNGGFEYMEVSVHLASAVASTLWVARSAGSKTSQIDAGVLKFMPSAVQNFEDRFVLGPGQSLYVGSSINNANARAVVTGYKLINTL